VVERLAREGARLRFRDSVELLEQFGSTSRSPHFEPPSKEPSSGSYDARVEAQLAAVYIFDQFRQARACSLEETSSASKKALFYPKIIHQAERIWKQYLARNKRGPHELASVG